MNDRGSSDGPTAPHPPVHGPASVVGVAVGVLLVAVAFLVAVPATWAFVVLPPLVGLLLMVRRGLPRQLGVGLLASGLAYPLLAAGPFALILVLG